VQELDDPVGGDDQQAVGLAAGRGELGDELGGRDSDRGRDALLVGIRPRNSSAIWAGRPNRRVAPPTSRKASSSEIASTSGVTERKISMMPAVASE